MNSPLLMEHPWIALLGWFPPAYLIGLIRTWGNSDYDVVAFEVFFGMAVTVPGFFWWPLNLFNRLRRDKARRLA